MDGELSLLGISIQSAAEVLRLDKALPIDDGLAVHYMGQCHGSFSCHSWHKLLPVEGSHAVGCKAVINDAEAARLYADR